MLLAGTAILGGIEIRLNFDLATTGLFSDAHNPEAAKARAAAMAAAKDLSAAMTDVGVLAEARPGVVPGFTRVVQQQDRFLGIESVLHIHDPQDPSRAMALDLLTSEDLRNLVANRHPSYREYDFQGTGPDEIVVFMGSAALDPTLDDAVPLARASSTGVTVFHQPLGNFETDEEYFRIYFQGMSDHSEFLLRGNRGPVAQRIHINANDEFDIPYEIGIHVGGVTLQQDTSERFTGGTANSATDWADYWHFDHETPVTTFPLAKTDMYSVVLHELLHVVGLGLSKDWEELVSDDGTWTGAFASQVYLDGLQATDHRDLRTIHGHPVGDEASWVITPASTVSRARSPLAPTYGSPQTPAIRPELVPGARGFLTGLDLALLEDIGWATVRAPNHQQIEVPQAGGTVRVSASEDPLQPSGLWAAQGVTEWADLSATQGNVGDEVELVISENDSTEARRTTIRLGGSTWTIRQLPRVDDHGDARADATSVGFGDFQDGKLHISTDVDFFRFEAPSTRLYRLILVDFGGMQNLDFLVLDAYGHVVMEIGGDESGIHDALVELGQGTYYLRVGTKSPEDEIPFQVLISETTGDGTSFRFPGWHYSRLHGWIYRSGLGQWCYGASTGGLGWIWLADLNSPWAYSNQFQQWHFRFADSPGSMSIQNHALSLVFWQRDEARFYDYATDRFFTVSGGLPTFE